MIHFNIRCNLENQPSQKWEEEASCGFLWRRIVNNKFNDFEEQRKSELDVKRDALKAKQSPSYIT